MQGSQLEVANQEERVTSDEQSTTPEENQTPVKSQKPSLSTLCKSISAYVDTTNTDHNILVAGLLMLIDQELSVVDIRNDILSRIDQALDNILSTSTSFSKRLARDWLPQFAELNILLKRHYNRPRSLEAVPSYSPMNLSLTPRETLQSPTRRNDSPRQYQQLEQRVSSPTKDMSQITQFWNDGEKLDQKKKQHAASSDDSVDRNVGEEFEIERNAL